MNPEQALVLAQEAIKKREPSKKDRWFLVPINNEIVCVPSEKLDPSMQPIAFLTIDDCHLGLRPLMWQMIARRIQAIIEKGELKL